MASCGTQPKSSHMYVALGVLVGPRLASTSWRSLPCKNLRCRFQVNLLWTISCQEVDPWKIWQKQKIPTLRSKMGVPFLLVFPWVLTWPILKKNTRGVRCDLLGTAHEALLAVDLQLQMPQLWRQCCDILTHHLGFFPWLHKHQEVTKTWILRKNSWTSNYGNHEPWWFSVFPLSNKKGFMTLKEIVPCRSFVVFCAGVPLACHLGGDNSVLKCKAPNWWINMINLLEFLTVFFGESIHFWKINRLYNFNFGSVILEIVWPSNLLVFLFPCLDAFEHDLHVGRWNRSNRHLEFHWFHV